MKEQKKTILVLVGRGKSTLSDWIMSLPQNNGKPWLDTIFGIKDFIKDVNTIKSDVSCGFRYIVHLQSEEDIKKIPLGLRRRSLIYKIDF